MEPYLQSLWCPPGEYLMFPQLTVSVKNSPKLTVGRLRQPHSFVFALSNVVIPLHRIFNVSPDISDHWKQLNLVTT